LVLSFAHAVAAVVTGGAGGVRQRAARRRDRRSDRRRVGVAITPAQLACSAAVGLDCNAALDCVSTPSPTACATPSISCDGDTLTMCDAFAGARIVTRDCAAERLHCIALGGEARCGLGACDPKTAPPACAGQLVTDCRRRRAP
jgi:hypothetical protein